MSAGTGTWWSGSCGREDTNRWRPICHVGTTRAGLPEYARTVVEAIGDRDDVVVVAQSFGGFTAPLVADLVPLRALVLVTAMIPAPGRRATG